MVRRFVIKKVLARGSLMAKKMNALVVRFMFLPNGPLMHKFLNFSKSLAGFWQMQRQMLIVPNSNPRKSNHSNASRFCFHAM
nr:MAG TPA: hypothetical protein [Caudoviricetes sp.]